MARTLTLSLPHPHLQNLNQILATQHIIRENFITSSSSGSSWTRIFSPKFCSNSKCINSYSNVNYIHNIRRLSTFFLTPLSSLSYSYLHLRKSCDCLCFSLLSLSPLRRSYSSSFGFLMMSHSGEDYSTVTQDSTKTIRCMIKGRVQGVFYRNWTVDNATQLGLKGWVRNRRDGSVEALFSGKAEAVDEMLQRCRRGPPEAMVTALDANPSNEDPGAGFERKSTV